MECPDKHVIPDDDYIREQIGNFISVILDTGSVLLEKMHQENVCPKIEAVIILNVIIQHLGHSVLVLSQNMGDRFQILNEIANGALDFIHQIEPPRGEVH